ncbi:MAG TPA: RNA polymerase sigma factor, partial [Gemmata sp.]|nr:RNA polymerase sigma factor [Gemmata sp.]
MSHLLQTMVHQLGRTVVREGLAKLGDSELLRRFTADSDSLAFEAIIWRHGTMVFDVCRRVLGRRGDAEDAFQATFLSLLRHACSVRSGESLAGWLYRVARRLSVRMSRQRDHRAHRESQAARPEAQIFDDVERTDWRRLLDREIERLPARYRDAFILCHLEGRDHKEAARELGCPLGTLHSRLARAKERLRAQLGLGGLVFPVVAT